MSQTVYSWIANPAKPQIVNSFEFAGHRLRTASVIRRQRVNSVVPQTVHAPGNTAAGLASAETLCHGFAAKVPVPTGE
jgi:hypothetical protein